MDIRQEFKNNKLNTVFGDKKKTLRTYILNVKPSKQSNPQKSIIFLKITLQVSYKFKLMKIDFLTCTKQTT